MEVPKTVSRLSLRDPSGELLEVQGKLIRFVDENAMGELEAAFHSPIFKKLCEDKQFPATRWLDAEERNHYLALSEDGIVREASRISAALEHERVFFPSFPHEWPAEMLYEAGKLTLNLALGLYPEGLGLKDATPQNILFSGPNPIFVDLLSIEKRNPRDASWLPFAQFLRTFLLPLLANRYFNLSLQMMFTSRRDGIEPEELYPMCQPWQRLLPPFFSLVTIPTWLMSRRRQPLEASAMSLCDNVGKAKFIFQSLLGHLKRQLALVQPTDRKRSVWSNYMAETLPYSSEQFQGKNIFLEAVTAELKPKTVLDIGCNTGHFSALAARSGAKVVAIDFDAAVVSSTWWRAKKDNLDVLPLVVNITRPSPAVGWRNRESASFIDRARGQFDMVFMLAVMHHMVVGERIPLKEVFELVAQITKRWLVIEFIGPTDVSVVRLRNARAGSEVLTKEFFERTLAPYFRIERQQDLPGSDRTLYCLEKKTN
jgi:SAM-dependent methyltransferase